MKNIFGLALTIVFLIMCESTSESQPPPAKNPDTLAEQVRDRAKLRWEEHLKATFKIGIDERQVTKAFLGISLTIERIPLGGSGAYEVIYRIDDYHQVRADFGLDKKLRQIPRIEDAKSFVRLPDGAAEEITWLK
jgi:hypothetical protein